MWDATRGEFLTSLGLVCMSCLVWPQISKQATRRLQSRMKDVVHMEDTGRIDSESLVQTFPQLHIGLSARVRDVNEDLLLEAINLSSKPWTKFKKHAPVASMIMIIILIAVFLTVCMMWALHKRKDVGKTFARICGREHTSKSRAIVKYSVTPENTEVIGFPVEGISAAEVNEM